MGDYLPVQCLTFLIILLCSFLFYSRFPTKAEWDIPFGAFVMSVMTIYAFHSPASKAEFTEVIVAVKILGDFIIACSLGFLVGSGMAPISRRYFAS